MDIIFINRTMSMIRGGGEVRDVRVAEGLKERGNSVSIITGKPIFKKVKFKPNKLNTYYVHSPWLHSLSKLILTRINNDLKAGGIVRRLDEAIFRRRALSAIRKISKNIDVVHLFGLGMAPLAERIEQLGMNSVLLLTTDSPVKRYSKELKSISGVLAVGKTKKFIPKGVRSLNIREPLPENFKIIDEEIKNNISEISENKQTILFVGRIVEEKRVKILLDIIDNIKSIRNDIQLVIVGDGPGRSEIVSKIEKRNLNDVVKILGSIENRKMHIIYNNSDVLVLPSKRESFSMVSVEALSCGVPVVSTKVGILDELVRNGKNGFLLDNIDTQNFSKKILKCLNSKKIKNYAKDKSENIRHKFSYEKIIPRIEDFMMKCS